MYASCGNSSGYGAFGYSPVKAVNYEELIPIMIKAIQEQQQQIDSLKQTDKDEQEQINGLKQTIATMQGSSVSAQSTAALLQHVPNPSRVDISGTTFGKQK